MPKVNKPLQQQYMSRIRRLLVVKPDVSVLEMSEALGLDRAYVTRLVKKIRGEAVKRMDLKTVNIVLAEFENLMSEGDRKMWQIINDETSTKREIVAAWKELRENNLVLFEKMFDAGIFERQLGKVKNENTLSDEELLIIGNAIKYAGNPDRPTKDTRGAS